VGKSSLNTKPATKKKTTPPTGTPGLVLAHYGQASLVETDDGGLIRCLSRKNLPRTVCGDRILFESSTSHDGVITQILDRTSTLVRPDRNGRIRPVAANIDQIVIVIASKPSFIFNMLDRYLVAAELINTRPIIVVNKQDLLSPDSHRKLEQRLETYTKLDYSVLFTSTLTTDGLKDLYQQLRQHTSVLVGQSGVGKSSLVQALLPDLDIRTGQLSKVTGLGRHTTTATTLYHLPDSGDLIDSPGVREFNLWPVDANELAYGFVEFRPYLGTCRFNNCQHNAEPGCQIKEAVRDKIISTGRLENYHDMLASQSN
jgi:ribosome biogenesis GTPase